MSAEEMAKLKAKLKQANSKLRTVNAANVRARAMICDAAGIPHDADILEWIAGAKDRIARLEDSAIDHAIREFERDMEASSACVFCPYKSNEEWRRLRDTDQKGWARALQIDEAIRDQDSACAKKHASRLYLHRSCLPLEKAPIDEPQSRETQYELSLVNECEGMCGL